MKPSFRDCRAEFPFWGSAWDIRQSARPLERKITYAKKANARKAVSDKSRYRNVVFSGCSQSILAARYHSLAADADTIPDSLYVTASTKDGEIMAVQHKEYPIYSVQFHPESIMTPEGRQILRNFIQGGIRHDQRSDRKNCK